MIFNRKTKTDQIASGIRYPDRIIIETRNKIDEYSWYSTDSLTVLPVDIPDAELGKIVYQHLNESKTAFISNEHIRALRDSYRKKAKFTSEKATMKDAKYTGIFRTDKAIRFEPKNNKMSSQGAWYGMPDKIFSIPAGAEAHLLGKSLREAWDRCIFT